MPSVRFVGAAAYHWEVINSAHLRIYLPDDRIGTFADHGQPRRDIVRVDEEFLWDESTRDDAYTVDWHGRSLSCPRYPRLRMLEGLLAFRNANPASALTSELAVRSAVQELAQIRAEAPAARSYILTAPWHVPLRWFMCFDPDEREFYDADGGFTSIRYRAGVATAVGRVERGIKVLDDAGFDAAIVDDVRDLKRWLDEFSADGMVELDYHTVADLFDETALTFDESAAEIARSLEALERFDYEDAGEAYAEVASRWAPAQALAWVN